MELLTASSTLGIVSSPVWAILFFKCCSTYYHGLFLQLGFCASNSVAQVV